MVPGTVRDQITLFDPSISDEQVQYAAHLTGLHDVICGFPDGYDTLCRTDLFSQGQWQLLSIARAVAANPRILLLDEITANLDADTEKAVLSALNRAGNGRTVLSVMRQGVLLIPLLYILQLIGGLDGVIYGQGITDWITVLLSVLFWNNIRKKL